MGAAEHINPHTLKPMPGKMVVQIVEVLGGETKAGLFIPGTLVDHMGKDTFYGKILSVGPAPALEHYDSPQGIHVRDNGSGNVWPDEIMDIFKEGDIVVMPRDVPLAFTWQEGRYAVVHLHEAILHIDADSFDPQEFEFVPWTPSDITNHEVVKSFGG